MQAATIPRTQAIRVAVPGASAKRMTASDAGMKSRAPVPAGTVMGSFPHADGESRLCIVSHGTFWVVNGGRSRRGTPVPGLAWWRSRKVATTSSAIVGAGFVGLAIAAALDDGLPTADVELHDGAVWVTNEATLMVGRLNYPSRILDSSLRTTTSSFDVFQEGSLVLVHDSANNMVSVVDPAMVASSADVTLPRGAEVALGDGIVIVGEPEQGRVWIMRSAWLASFDKDSVEPAITLGREVAVTVTPDGTGYAVSAETGRAATLSITVDGEIEVSETSAVDLGETNSIELAAVGTKRVLWDEDNGSLVLSSGKTHDFPAGSRLQQTSGARDAVSIATPSALVHVPLDGGEPEVWDLGTTGRPAAPVSINGCTYSAWAGSGLYVRDCEGEDYDVEQEIDGTLPSSAFEFRVNRDVVVLNDYVNGTSFLVEEGLERVSNWEDLLPPPDEERQEDTPDDELTDTLPDRDELNTPPVAEDDAFGARAGRTTVIPVVDNDYDYDGDVLTATVVDATGVPGRVEQIRGGAALQVSLAGDASGRAQFTYRVSDGRGGVDDATVSIEISGEGDNEPPEPRRRSRLSLEVGATATYNVIPDWIDPDGDLLFLREARGNDIDRVDYTPDGRITITASSQVQGSREIEVVVSDGRTDVEGILSLEVLPEGTKPPLTNSDHVVTTVGAPVVVSPLGNDISRSARPIRLVTFSEVRNATVVPDYAAGTLTFSSSNVGTFYIQYAVTDDKNESSNLIRVDVIESVESSLPPIAVADVALVAPGDDVLVDVLANDIDPAGSVLVVQGVDVPADSGVSVAVLEHHLVRVTNVAGITEPVTLRYRVSNGAFTSESEITVMPIEPPSRYLAPVAYDDEVTVRVGDIASVDVLANDIHPSQRDFSLDDLAEPAVDPSFAEVFVSEDRIRIKAGAEPGQAKATYTIVDDLGQRAAAQVTIRIVGAEDGNSAPRPADVTARALSGGSVRIPIPLDGVDPDGDSVTLLGASDAPQLGRVVQTGQDWLVYEAYTDAQGTDRFTYTVRDALGLEAQATVVVGVAPPEFVNHAPMCMRDDASVRPKHAISYPVMINDSDPDADPMSLVTDALTVPEGIEASVAGDRILVEAAEEGLYTIIYTVSDVYGSTSTCALAVNVDPETPLVAPIARDDRVAAEDIEEDGTVVVDVLDNDEDPDGVASRLEVTVNPLDGTVGAGGMVTLTAEAAARIVTYTITDADGLSASAFILVPGLGDMPPALMDAAPVEVTSGETIDLPLEDLVKTSNGNPAIITEAERVFAAHANGEPLVIDQTTLQYTSAEGYYGKDAITFQVTDGRTIDDPAGHRATLTLPLIVRPAENVPPTFRNTTLTITAGGAAGTVDLSVLSDDANPGDKEKLTWGVGTGNPAGFDVDVDGAIATIAAERSVAGAEYDVNVWVSDGGSERVNGVVRVTVLAASDVDDAGEEIPAELPIANDDAVPDAQAGKQSVVNVLRNDVNPYVDKPLDIITTTIESGKGAVTIDGENLLITPDSNFAGTLIIRYTIADASGLPSRQANARVMVTVAKQPEAPSKPQIRSVGDRTVELQWTEPPANGAPITGYTVTSDQGTSTACSSTICTITGLTNDTEYRFSVVATNKVGDSAPSAPSDVARPDIHPEQPDAPVLTFGDKALDIVWTAPESKGSPVRSYTLEISPAPAGGSQVANLTGTSYRWTGLENGVAYQVRVRAYNDAVDPSSWSDYSASEVPAGVPERVAKPTTTRLSPVGNRAQIGVQWTVPAGNGDAVGSFTVNAIRSGSVVSSQTVGAGVTNVAFALDPSSSDYTFTVVAHNKAGASTASQPSDPRRAFVAPGAPTGVSAVAGDRSLTVSFTPGAANGSDSNWITYQYSLNGSESWSNLPANGVISGLSNGTSYTVRVRAQTTSDGATYNSTASSASAARVPFGPIGAPSVSASSGSGEVNFTVTAPATNGRPIESIEYRTKVGSGGWSSWTNAGITSGSKSIKVATGGPGISASLEARAKATDTPTSNSGSATASSKPRKSWVTKGSKEPGYANSHRLVINWSEFQTGTYKVTCRDNYGSTDYITETRYTVNVSNPSGSKELTCFTGYPGIQVYVTWEDGPGTPFNSDILIW